jgi:hypothetical protein
MAPETTFWATPLALSEGLPASREPERARARDVEPAGLSEVRHVVGVLPQRLLDDVLAKERLKLALGGREALRCQHLVPLHREPPEPRPEGAVGRGVPHPELAQHLLGVGGIADLEAHGRPICQRDHRGQDVVQRLRRGGLLRVRLRGQRRDHDGARRIVGAPCEVAVACAFD